MLPCTPLPSTSLGGRGFSRSCIGSRLPLSTSKAGQGNSETSSNKAPIIQTRPPRQSAPPPEQVPIEHSSAYILRSKRSPEQEDEEDELLPSSSSRREEPFTGNAVEWYLRRLDKSLDSGDESAPAAARAYYKASKTQAGNSAARGVGSVVGTAAKLGVSAVKAAAPVGKWAVLQGLGAAGRAILPSKQSSKRSKD